MKRPYFAIISILIVLICSFPYLGLSQCTNTIKFPTEDIIASPFNEPIVITTEQHAGQYYKITNLIIGKTYEFTSDTPNDYFSIRDADGLTLVAQGATPLSHTVSGDDILTVHINLLSPPCGFESVNRKCP